ncbi:MAG: glycosyltransferase [Rhodanobacteraceae bacterium]
MPPSPARRLRVCLVGPAAPTATAIENLRVQVPATSALVRIGPDSDSVDQGIIEHLRAEDAGYRSALQAAAERYPGEDLILVDTVLLGDGSIVPDYACARLLRAIQETGVLVASALGDATLGPFGNDEPRSGDPIRIDALCFAYSRRLLIDDASSAFTPALLSAWHGQRLATLAAERAFEPDLMQTAGLRRVLLDHLFVSGRKPSDPDATDTPNRPDASRSHRNSAAALRDPLPPSPLAPLRDRLDEALAEDAWPGRPGLDEKPVLLHILHGWGGGADRWVRDFAAADANAQHLALIARGSVARKCHGEWLELHDGHLGGPPLRRIPLPRPIADTALTDIAYRAILTELIGDYCVDAIVLSSLIGHSLDVLRTGLPTLRVVHDHYPLWPLLHRDFGDPALRFDDAQLEADLAAAGAHREFAESDPAHWRRLRDATVAALCSANAVLVAPSRSALANELRLAPELGQLPQHVIAHGCRWPDSVPRVPEPPPRERLRLVVPGRIRRGKGSDLLIAALPGLLAHADLFLLGAGSDAHDLFGQRGVHVLLDYRREDLPELIARLRPDAALIVPTVAETFSYTLSELRGLGVPVIATRVGALAERIDDGVNGFLVEPHAESVVARVAALADDRAMLATVRKSLAAWREPDPAGMAASYTAVFGLPAQPVARYRLGSLDAHALETAALIDELDHSRRREAGLAARIAALDEEVARRGDWGHALDRELEDLRAQFDERTRWALKLRDEVDAMRDSSSWRLTRPLRGIKTRWNALRGGGLLRGERIRAITTALLFRAARARSLIRRTRASIARRGITGTLERIRQEFRSGPAQEALRVPLPSRNDSSPFCVPTADDAPQVSIVVPVFNQIAYTTACLRSLAANAGDVTFEVIVVDDASTDGTARRLAAVAGVRVLRNVENLGFVGSCNAGAAAARGDFVLFLNNDTVVTTGWLESLLRCFAEEPDCGLVGAKLVYPDGRLQEAGGIVFDDGSGWNYGRFSDPLDPRFNFRREVDYCSGAAIMLRRGLFERLGGFDARYTPAYYEDTDLAFQVRAAGLKVYCEPAATVVHFEGVTAGTDTAVGIKQHQLINHETFVAKWKDALAAQPMPGTPIAHAATWRARKRVLIIDATAPTPDMDSGSMRMTNLMRILHRRGCQVTFLPDNRAWIERYTPALQSLGVEALYHPFVLDPVGFFRERGIEFDAIVLSRHYVAASYIGLARLYAPQAKLVFDTVDLHYLREQRAAALSARPNLQHAAATRAQELKVMRECDLTLVVSPIERDLLAIDAPDVHVEVLSNVHDIPGCRTPFAERQDLVFVGGFQHPPNVDAVEWLVQEILPRVAAALPHVRTHIIGSRVTPEIRKLASDSVLIHGYVEDIAPFMDGARIGLAPLRYGAGVKGKVNLAMSYGLPVVATTCAIEGMHARADQDVLVADTAEDFAAAIVGLYDDEAVWTRLSTNGMENVRRYFSFDAATRVVDRIFEI